MNECHVVEVNPAGNKFKSRFKINIDHMFAGVIPNSLETKKLTLFQNVVILMKIACIYGQCENCSSKGSGSPNLYLTKT